MSERSLHSGSGPHVFRATRSPAEAAAWSRRHELSANLRAVMGRAYPRLIGARREPSWLFFEVFLPFLTMSSFVFVYRALGAPDEFVGFVVLGGAMTAFWLNVMWLMAGQLWWDRDAGNLPLYMTAPVDLMSILLGMAVGGIGMTLTRAMVVLGIGTWLYSVRFSVEQWGLLALVFLLTLVALYGLGMVLSSLFLLWGRVTGIGGEGSVYSHSMGQAAPDSGTIVLALLATTLLGTLAAAAAFAVSERRAKDRGLIDQTTGS